jgi:molybdate transport repressor ModE-like protein
MPRNAEQWRSASTAVISGATPGGGGSPRALNGFYDDRRVRGDAVSEDRKTGARTAAREPWLGVELRHLAALLAVARTGSFRQAADELGYVQSAISQQIAFLEQLVGTRVVERTRGMRGVSVTEAGEALLVHAEQIVGRFHAARADLAALANDERPVLRLGLPHGVAAGLLPPVLRRLAIDAPAVRIAPTEATREAPLLEALERGDLDAAVVELPVSSSALRTVPLLPDPHVLIVASGSRIAQVDRPLTADDLRDLPLVVHAALPGIEAHLRAQGFAPWVAFRSASTATVEAMVAAGVGGAIVPTLVLGPPTAGTVRIGLGDLVPPRAVGICWHRDRRRCMAIEAFCEAAMAVQDANAALAEAMGDAPQPLLSQR